MLRGFPSQLFIRRVRHWSVRTVLTLCYAIILFLISWRAVGQDSPPFQNPNLLSAAFLPKSPTVSSFGRFDAQQQVDLKTGAAQLAIPLVQLTSGPLQLAVSLNYSYSGLKVYQPQDLVGLGWSLQAGGSITRQINGLPDDQVTSYGRYDSTLVIANANANSQNFLRNAINQDVDTAPDVYSFSVGGYTGRFTLQQGVITLLPKQPIKIEEIPGQGFQLCAETGVRYLFTAPEVTKPNANNFGRIGTHTSAWQLTRVIAAGNTDTLNLHYTPHSYREPRRCVSTTGQYFPGWENGGIQIACKITEPYTWHNIAPLPSEILVQYLDSITTRGARICLTRSQGSNSGHQVQQVRLLSLSKRGRHCVRAFSLRQSYFTTVSSAEKWLRLDEVQEWNGESMLPPYRFVYEEGGFPSHTSTAQDYWGYYNGQVQNFHGIDSDLFPALLADPLLNTLGFQPARRIAANRQPSLEHAQLGALRQITYPTGGSTRFTYESNTYEYEHVETRIIEEVLEATQGHDLADMAPNPDDSYDQIKRLPSGSTTIFIDPAKARVNDIIKLRISLSRRASSDEGIAKNKSHDLEVFKKVASGDSLVVIKRNGQRDHDTTSVTLYVTAGTYIIKLFAEEPDEDNIALIQLAYDEITRDRIGPGIRVRQTTTTTVGSPALVKMYTYTLSDPSGTRSSGVTLLPVTHLGTPKFEVRPFYLFRWDGPNIAQCVLANTSSDYSGEGHEQSKFTFFYRCVTEHIGGSPTGLGATANYFRVVPEQFDEVILHKQLVYRYLPDSRLSDAQRLQVAQRTTYHYTPSARITYPLLRVWQTEQKVQETSGGPLFQGPLEGYTPRLTRFSAAFLAADNVRQVRYSEQGDSTITVQVSGYREQRLVRFATQAAGKWLISRYKYLHEYASSLPGGQLLRRNNFNPVIETQTWQRLLVGTDSVVTGGHITQYHAYWQRPDSSWYLALTHPQPRLNAEHRLNGLYTTLRSDSHYQLTATLAYDPSTGTIQQQQPAHGSPTAYVWGYQLMAPIAEVKNASFQQIAYTSFELSELGAWQGTGSVQAGGYTGLDSYLLTGGSLTSHVLPARTYQLSCWLKEGTGLPTVNGQALVPTSSQYQGWRLHQRTLTLPTTGVVTLSGTGQLDELRLHPIGAQMTTYTHQPLVGETSQTDPSHRTARYEYDELGRLLRVRNEKGEILTQQQYHYARP